jgi:RNA polymerase sigma factor (sigma-70 family)
MYKQSDKNNLPLIEILRLVQIKDDDAQLLLLERFDRSIKSFTYKLNYDGANTDLIIFILELCQKVDLIRFENLNEGAVVKYIYNSLRHEYIRLSKLNSRFKLNEQLYGIDPSELISNHNTTEENLYFDKYVEGLINILTEKERQVIVYTCILEYSDVETAKMLGISKQAVGKTKKRALRKLRCELDKD